MDAKEAFWKSYLNRSEVQKKIKLEQKMLIYEQAVKLETEYKKESELLRKSIANCDEETQNLIKPILHLSLVHRNLYNFLCFCNENNILFHEELTKNEYLIGQLKCLKDEYLGDTDNTLELDKKWEERRLEAKEKLLEEKENKKKKLTWKDMPRSELAERLSKGEILPREEWIPGISECKRRLDKISLKEHLELGEQMRCSGKMAFEKKDFNMAFTRFTQGVQLLNWVEGTNKEDSEKIKDLYLSHLNNQALCALKINKFQEAIKACTSVLQEIDEFDNKARYRRGKAYLFLGLITAAKDDFLFILKNPYADEYAKQSARYGMRELRKILCRSKNDTKFIINQSLQNNLFSEDRKFEEKANEKKKENNSNLLILKDDKNFRDINTAVSEDQKAKEEHQKKNIKLNLEETKNLLENILILYTSDEVQKVFGELRRLSDYEERRFLIRLRSYLPKILTPILNEFNFNTYNDYISNKMDMERTVNYWKGKDEEVKILSKECWDAIFDQLPDCA